MSTCVALLLMVSGGGGVCTNLYEDIHLGDCGLYAQHISYRHPAYLPPHKMGVDSRQLSGQLSG
jgi:hypothetical protein